MDRVVKPLVMAVTAAGLVVAFGYLLYLGWAMISRSEYLAMRGLGVGIILLTVVGAWAMWAILRNGFELQRISAAAADEGIELDISGLDQRPSGRLEHAAADSLFDRVSAEYEAAPDDWRTNYRLARAYDHAGDRARAREVMRAAIGLREASTGEPPQ
ncbi:hypothetical protein [Dietzia sp. PP-33]|jgi:ABC-type nickel/cobalt efflux system permease component RcnA|uniref:hypothetical protein n=1 Tax=Dietzia sp. PP-33 TaxID=2957500 RepID=UPI0029B52F96|nr:hypothetical protein [Dietzia sp. PP-33]MDX2355587.1 hypothetical protein [Dietzia sp. PP-33]